MRTEKEIRDALLTIPDDETVENPCEMGHYAGYRNALEWVLEGKSNYRALLEEAVRLIIDIADQLNSEGGYGHLEIETWDKLDAYATRAKERLGNQETNEDVFCQDTDLME